VRTRSFTPEALGNATADRLAERGCGEVLILTRLHGSAFCGTTRASSALQRVFSHYPVPGIPSTSLRRPIFIRDLHYWSACTCCAFHSCSGRNASPWCPCVCRGELYYSLSECRHPELPARSQDLPVSTWKVYFLSAVAGAKFVSVPWRSLLGNRGS